MESGDGLLRLAARLCVDSGRNRLQRACIHPQSGPSGPNTYYVPSPGILYISASSGAEIGQLRLARGFPRRARYWM